MKKPFIRSAWETDIGSTPNLSRDASDKAALNPGSQGAPDRAGGKFAPSSRTEKATLSSALALKTNTYCIIASYAAEQFK